MALLATTPALAQPQRGPSAPAAPAPAPAPAHIEVLVLDASLGDGGIAAPLAGLPQLRQLPFSAFPQISLLSRVTLPLEANPSNAPLPNGGQARVSLEGRTPEGRYTVNVAFVQGAQTSTLQVVMSAGEPFFTVRARGITRALVLGFIVRP